MKFPLRILDEQKNREKLLEVLKSQLCDNCVGRQFGMLGHGMSNAERGEILRNYAGRITKTDVKGPKLCRLCNNFFKDKINQVASEILKSFKNIEFRTFLVGSILSGEMIRRQDELWERAGIEDVEPLKSEINRELGKIIEKKSDKTFLLKNPDVTVVANLQTGKIKTNIRSLYVSGGYSKLVRGIPQTMWICGNCGGKGCVVCKGTGKLYPTSVQEIIEKSFLKAAKAKSSSFHGAGREDIDARNLDYRPFVIEILQPKKRKIDLKKIGKQINKNKKVKVRALKFVGKELIEKLKKAKIDKTYEAKVEFEKTIDKKKLAEVRKLPGTMIHQQTPTRVAHRRADILRKRAVRKISWKLKSKKKIIFKIRAESGLYIKELINGDEGRTRPSIAEILANKVKTISLDVVKIHSKV